MADDANKNKPYVAPAIHKSGTYPRITPEQERGLASQVYGAARGGRGFFLRHLTSAADNLRKVHKHLWGSGHEITEEPENGFYRLLKVGRYMPFLEFAGKFHEDYPTIQNRFYSRSYWDNFANMSNVTNDENIAEMQRQIWNMANKKIADNNYTAVDSAYQAWVTNLRNRSKESGSPTPDISLAAFTRTPEYTNILKKFIAHNYPEYHGVPTGVAFGRFHRTAFDDKNLEGWHTKIANLLDQFSLHGDKFQQVLLGHGDASDQAWEAMQAAGPVLRHPEFQKAIRTMALDPTQDSNIVGFVEQAAALSGLGKDHARKVMAAMNASSDMGSLLNNPQVLTDAAAGVTPDTIKNMDTLRRWGAISNGAFKQYQQLGSTANIAKKHGARLAPLAAFYSNPLMFILSSLFGNPSQLYQLNDILKYTYNPRTDEERVWASDVNAAIPNLGNYKPYLPWLDLLVGFRKNFS